MDSEEKVSKKKSSRRRAQEGRKPTSLAREGAPRRAPRARRGPPRVPGARRRTTSEGRRLGGEARGGSPAAGRRGAAGTPGLLVLRRPWANLPSPRRGERPIEIGGFPGPSRTQERAPGGGLAQSIESLRNHAPPECTECDRGTSAEVSPASEPGSGQARRCTRLEVRTSRVHRARRHSAGRRRPTEGACAAGAPDEALTPLALEVGGEPRSWWAFLPLPACEILSRAHRKLFPARIYEPSRRWLRCVVVHGASCNGRTMQKARAFVTAELDKRPPVIPATAPRCSIVPR